ncbi:MAG: uL30 family ribosomal protein [Rhodococcus qingshengii]
MGNFRRLGISTRPSPAGAQNYAISGLDSTHCVLDPVESLAPVDVHSFGGTLLVTQVKSEIGRKLNQRENLRSLKLSHQKGFIVVPDDRRHPQFGQVKAVQHLLTIVRLSEELPAGDFTLAISKGRVQLSNHEGVMKPRYENYSSELGAGEALVLGDGEYVQVETTNGITSTSWTSTLSAIEALKSVTESSNAGECCAGFIQLIGEAGSDGAFKEGSVDDLIQLVLDGLPVSYISLDFGTHTFVWSEPDKRAVGAKRAFSEIGYVTANLRLKDVVDMVDVTASPLVKGGVPYIVPRIKQLESSAR